MSRADYRSRGKPKQIGATVGVGREATIQRGLAGVKRCRQNLEGVRGGATYQTAKRPLIGIGQLHVRGKSLLDQLGLAVIPAGQLRQIGYVSHRDVFSLQQFRRIVPCL